MVLNAKMEEYPILVNIPNFLLKVGGAVSETPVALIRA